VAMATYNGERYLPEMLGSLAAQTRLPDELVVRDDGSTDGTLAVVDDFAARAGFPVRVLPAGDRLGYAQNFVTVSRACTGDLLFFADQDDVWHADKLETIERAAPVGEPAALFHDFSLQSGDGSPLAPSFFGVLAERGFGPTVALKGCTIAITRAFIDTWDWPPPMSRVSHDLWVALLATAFGQRRILTDVLIDHRIHETNTSGWIPGPESRAFTSPGDGSSDVDILVDLLIKRRRLRARTEALLEVLRERGDAVDPAASQRLRRSLRINRRHYRELRKAEGGETP
jgi:glycosyltransferase involved in cell wall biosynthesis